MENGGGRRRRRQSDSLPPHPALWMSVFVSGEGKESTNLRHKKPRLSTATLSISQHLGNGIVWGAVLWLLHLRVCKGQGHIQH